MVRAHLNACWKCRARRHELENAIVDFVRIHQQDLDAKMPPPEGPRALLKARIAQLSGTEPDWRSEWFTVSRGLACAAAICLLAFGLFLIRSNIVRQRPSRTIAWVVSIPHSRLTPGATLLVSRSSVCAGSNTKNRPVTKSIIW
jgi:hypothetical protein